MVVVAGGGGGEDNGERSGRRDGPVSQAGSQEADMSGLNEADTEQSTVS